MRWVSDERVRWDEWVMSGWDEMSEWWEGEMRWVSDESVRWDEWGMWGRFEKSEWWEGEVRRVNDERVRWDELMMWVWDEMSEWWEGEVRWVSDEWVRWDEWVMKGWDEMSDWWEGYLFSSFCLWDPNLRHSGGIERPVCRISNNKYFQKFSNLRLNNLPQKKSMKQNTYLRHRIMKKQ
jgi:hypothetical protein